MQSEERRQTLMEAAAPEDDDLLQLDTYRAMMLDHLGETQSAKAILTGIEEATAQGIGTRPSQNTTTEITSAVLAALKV